MKGTLRRQISFDERIVKKKIGQTLTQRIMKKEMKYLTKTQRAKLNLVLEL